MSSKSIDERVVDMKFKNQQFESGVRESLRSLAKLKEGLKLDKSAKSLSGLSDTAKKFSLAGIASGVDTIASKFSTLGILGVTALQNIENQAIHAAEQLAKSLLVDPITAGYSDYIKKLTSIQTIQNATGMDPKAIEKYFDRLDTYADKTIYNLDDMTSAFAKFTNAGIDMDDAIPAIIGIANMVADAGQDANAASIAMYNLSQSLSGGFLNTMDYKSLSLANITTTRWKDLIAQTAVEMGKLKKNKQGLYTIPGVKGAFTVQQLFNEQLSKGWATTEVLLKVFGEYADVTTEVGARAQAAAQDVKSFGMMMETLGAAVGTGWTDTFMLIIGDLDESKALFTSLTGAVGGFLDSTSQARNAMLKVWKDNGGRDALIQSFKNLAAGAQSVIKPISEAFKAIFPPIAGSRLADLTKAFEAFTAKLKVSKETGDKIRSVFKGLFAVVDILLKVFAAGRRILFGWLRLFTPMKSGVLDLVASFGDWLVKLNETIEKGDLFNKAIDKVKAKIIDLSGKAKTYLGKAVDSFEAFTGLDFTNFTTFFDTLKAKMKPLGKIGEDAKTAFKNIGEAISVAFTNIGLAWQKVEPFFSRMSAGVGRFFGAIGAAWEKAKPFFVTVGQALKQFFKDFDIDRLIGVFSTGVIGTAIIAITNLIKSIKESVDNSGGFREELIGILSEVKDCFKAYQNEIKAITLLKIASAIAVLAGSLYLLSMIDTDKLTDALTSITVLFGELMGSLGLLDKMMKGKDASTIASVTRSMVILSISLLLLAKAASDLGDMNWDQVAIGLGAVIGLMVGLVVSIKALSKMSKDFDLTRMGIGLLALAAALEILALAVVTIGKADPDTIIKGILGVIGACSALVLFLETTKFDSMTAGRGVGLLAVAVAVGVLALAVKAFGKMDPKIMLQGVAALGIVLTELALFSQFSQGGKEFIGTATGMLIMAFALGQFAKAIERFGKIPISTFIKGMFGIAYALGIVIAAMRLMPKDMVKIGVGMFAFATGLSMLAEAIMVFGNMSWEQMTKGMLMLGASLILLVGAVNAIQGSISGGVAILAIAGALLVLSLVFKILGSMDINQIILALSAMFGALTLIAVFGTILGPIAPQMFLVAGAIAVLSLSLALLGGALLVASIGLGAFAVSGVAIGPALATFLPAMLALTALSPGILAVGVALLALGIGMAAAGLAMFMLAAGLALFMALGPGATEALMAMATTAAQISSWCMELIAAGAGLLAFGAGAVIAGVGALLAGLGILVLAKGMEALAAVDMSNLDGFSIRALDLLAASGSLMLAAPGLSEGGKALETLGWGAKRAGEGFATVSTNFMDIINTIKNVPTDMQTAGNSIVAAISYVISGVTTMMQNGKVTITTTSNEMVNASLMAINSKVPSFFLVGANVVNGVIGGIQSRTGAAVYAATTMASAVLNATNGVFDSHSPSRKLFETGMNADLGLANGLRDYANVAVQAATDVGKRTITPVIDMVNRAPLGIQAMGQGIQDATNKAMAITPEVKTEKTVTMKHTFDKLTVEGVNNKGEFVAAADYSVEQVLTAMMRRQSRT